MEEALTRIFKDNPNEVLEIEDLYNKFLSGNYYKLTDYQKEDDPKYPSPRYKHMIRSIIARLKKKGIITRISRNKYKFKIK